MLWWTGSGSRVTEILRGHGLAPLDGISEHIRVCAKRSCGSLRICQDIIQLQLTTLNGIGMKSHYYCLLWCRYTL